MEIARSKYTQYLVVTAKLIVTACLLYWLISILDFESLRNTLVKISIPIIMLAMAMQILAFLLGAVRWWLLLNHAQGKVAFTRILPSYYLGLFFNNFLPTGMGGDVVRLLHLKLRGMKLRYLVTSTVMDRGIGLVIVLLIGTMCSLLSSEIGSFGIDRDFLIISVVILIVGIAIIVSPWFGDILGYLHRRYRETRIRRETLETALLCYSYRSRPLLVLLAALLSLAMQTLVIGVYAVLGYSLGLNLPLVTYFVFIPIVFLASSLPISIGGLGVREGVLVGLLIASSADQQLAISLSLLYLLVLWLTTLPGAAILLTRHSTLNKTMAR